MYILVVTHPLPPHHPSNTHSRHSLLPKEDSDATGTSSPESGIVSSSPPPPSSLSPAGKEKQKDGKERAKEEQKGRVEKGKRPQEPESKGGIRTITSDEEFEWELRQAGETLVVVDFTLDW